MNIFWVRSQKKNFSIKVAAVYKLNFFKRWFNFINLIVISLQNVKFDFLFSKMLLFAEKCTEF